MYFAVIDILLNAGWIPLSMRPQIGDLPFEVSAQMVMQSMHARFTVLDSTADMQGSSRIIKRRQMRGSWKLQLLTAIYWRGWATARPIDMLRPEANFGANTRDH
jgi:hypothetical protein